MANEYRFSSLAAEIVRNGASEARFSSLAVEVVRSIAGTASATRRRQIVNN